MRYGSVCSGIEAATVAWHPLGWSPAWFAEIEAYPSAVLAHHYPSVQNLGDMTAIAALVSSGEVEAPDILVGGTPCQAFSVAGLRGGLSDARGQLTISYVELANAIDAARAVRGEQPAITVWENVPGVLSSKDNAFGCFLGALAGEDRELKPPGGKWKDAGCVFGPQRAVAWRVLDAQYFGLAQRRRRVFVVSSAREGFDPAALLFEFDGVRRDTAPSREPGQDVTHDLAPCLTSSGRGVERTGDTRGQDPVVAVRRIPVAFGGNNQSGPIDVATARNACASASGRMDFETETFVVQPPVCYGLTTEQTPKFSEDCALTLTKQSPTGGGQPQAVAYSVALRGRDGGATAELGDDLSGCLRASGGGGDKAHVLAPIAFSCKDYGADAGAISPTLRAMGHSGSHANAGGQVAVAFDSRQDPVSSEHVFGALGSSSPQAQAVAYAIHENQRAELTLNDTAGAIKCAGGKPGQGYPAALVGVAVAHRDVMPTMVSGGSTDASHNQMSGQFREEYIVPHAMPVDAAYSTKLHNTSSNQSGKLYEEYTVSLDAGSPPPALVSVMAVRRLTPVECERLQGFPDGYTFVPSWNGWRKMDASETPESCRAEGLEVRQNTKTGKWRVKDVDGPRYKALGNSMATNVMAWIGRRIAAVTK